MPSFVDCRGQCNRPAVSKSVGRCACLATMVLMKKEEDFTAFLVYCARACLHGAPSSLFFLFFGIQEKIKRQNGRATSGWIFGWYKGVKLRSSLSGWYLQLVFGWVVSLGLGLVVNQKCETALRSDPGAGHRPPHTAGISRSARFPRLLFRCSELKANGRSAAG